MMLTRAAGCLAVATLLATGCSKKVEPADRATPIAPPAATPTPTSAKPAPTTPAGDPVDPAAPAAAPATPPAATAAAVFEGVPTFAVGERFDDEAAARLLAKVPVDPDRDLENCESHLHRLIADLDPATPGDETILASFIHGVAVFDAKGTLLWSVLPFDCAGSSDGISELAIADVGAGRPVIVVESSIGGRNMSDNYTLILRPSTTSKTLITLFDKSTFSVESGDELVGDVRLVKPGTIAYVKPSEQDDAPALTFVFKEAGDASRFSQRCDDGSRCLQGTCTAGVCQGDAYNDVDEE